MVSTRTKTNSLPARRTTLADDQAAASTQTVTPQSSPAKAAPPVKAPSKAGVKRKAGAVNKQIPKKRKPAKATAKATTDLEAVSIPPDDEAPLAGHDALQAEGPTTFLSLPPELRNEIYSYNLLTDHPILLQVYKPHPGELSLLRVSRQVRDEALPVFYGANVFEANSVVMLRRYLKTLNRQKMRALRMVHINPVHEHTRQHAIKSLRSLEGDFSSLGLRRDAIQYSDGYRLRKWVNLDQLLELEGEA
ncbi:uncharacterized protein LTR77_009352 [Saxophila tyrrhenica]|uniref:F-box domain-containing protein n=1 Tax=Saxophila tyrrhenica TaxID=1690608 RepID=A0AAV9NYU1_9PEZI|nr:hypothetical protein LTR77_009352 [Saxophila tyrrhenica]